MNYQNILDRLREDVIKDILSLFDGESKPHKILLKIPYIFQYEFITINGERGLEDIFIYGVYYNGDVVAETFDNEERMLDFSDLCCEDLINLHTMFTTNEVVKHYML